MKLQNFKSKTKAILTELDIVNSVTRDRKVICEEIKILFLQTSGKT